MACGSRDCFNPMELITCMVKEPLDRHIYSVPLCINTYMLVLNFDMYASYSVFQE